MYMICMDAYICTEGQIIHNTYSAIKRFMLFLYTVFIISLIKINRRYRRTMVQYVYEFLVIIIILAIMIIIHTIIDT